MSDTGLNNKALVHIIVVGFHHKKGCQVEFSYPPLIEGNEYNSPLLPEEWKCLPFLALPDGAHNHDEDTIYFHLPPRKEYSSQTTVYGVSCYRQIAAKLLVKKDEDVTRETVQKSVVALSQLPIYGILHAKLKMITQAYFEEKDFTKNAILKELFHHMNLSIKVYDESKKFLGLSPRFLVLNFQHKVLVLFKLLLLERRVLFCASPVEKLVGGIMSLLSLFPNMIENGLSECTVTYQQHCQTFGTKLSRENSINDNIDSSVNNQAKNGTSDSPVQETNAAATSGLIIPSINEQSTSELSNSSEANLDEDEGIILSTLHHSSPPRQTSPSVWEATSEVALSIAASVSSKLSSTITSTLYSDEAIEAPNLNIANDIEDDEEDQRMQSSFSNSRLEIKSESPAKSNIHEYFAGTNELPSDLEETDEVSREDFKSTFSTNKYGFPLSIFTRGHICLPYVALQQFSDLTDNFDRGYVIGATNILFKTQTHLAEVVVDIENGLLDIRDPNLRRQLHLSAADLRFAENLVNNTAGSHVDDVFLDATGWEGGDEWIQGQFAEYILSMLSLSVTENANQKELHDFNEQFLAAWKGTINYKVWLAGDHKAIQEIKAAHPCQAQYTVNDMRLRLHHNLQSSDRGRKLEDAMSSANQAVQNTGKYMGTALISAKSTVSSWLSSKIRREPSS